jgi:hypothetical protein
MPHDRGPRLPELPRLKATFNIRIPFLRVHVSGIPVNMQPVSYTYALSLI